MESLHNRKFVPSGIALVKGRLENTAKTDRQNIIERILIQSGILENAPFLWIGMNYRYGLKNDLNVEFSRISSKYGDINLSFELDMEILKWADKNNIDLLRDVFIISALEAFIQLCKKYKLSTTIFEEERAKYGNIPNTIEECEAYKSL